MSSDNDEQDWEITKEGLYIATRGFLTRRGYCCANRCRNCPYINWRLRPDWQPIPAERVLRTHVSPKAVAGAQEMLHYHEQQSQQRSSQPTHTAHHHTMMDHYRLLLQRWGEKQEENL